MKITIACVGKIKEKYLTAGIEEFTKRLQPFCKLETIAIGEERMPEDPSPALKEQVLGAKIEKLALAGSSHITFVIGGAFGYTDALRHRADERISFSKMTFTHQMIRLLLVEQIYRAFKISRGEKYHW